jgi:hypothetical protein
MDAITAKKSPEEYLLTEVFRHILDHWRLRPGYDEPWRLALKISRLPSVFGRRATEERRSDPVFESVAAN